MIYGISGPTGEQILQRPDKGSPFEGLRDSNLALRREFLISKSFDESSGPYCFRMLEATIAYKGAVYRRRSVFAIKINCNKCSAKTTLSSDGLDQPRNRQTSLQQRLLSLTFTRILYLYTIRPYGLALCATFFTSKAQSTSTKKKKESLASSIFFSYQQTIVSKGQARIPRVREAYYT